MTPENNAHVFVYQVLDQVLADKVVSPGSTRAMVAAIDKLRASRAPSDYIRCAEDIAIEIHKLQWALQRSDGLEAQSALTTLQALAASWIDTRIRVPA